MLLFFFSKGVITLAMDIFFAFDKEQKFDRRPDFGRDIQKKKNWNFNRYSNKLDFFLKKFLIVEMVIKNRI